MKHFVDIQSKPIDVLDHTDKFASAAAKLAISNSVFLFPPEVASSKGVLTGDERLVAMVEALNTVSTTWDTLQNAPRQVTREQDIDMHGNPYEPYMLSPDYLHYHHTPEGKVRATFARAFDRYLHESPIAKPLLTEALREGKTDPRYADPTSFEVAHIGPGDALIFRLNEQASGLPLLHDFTTTSSKRIAEITAVYRLD